MAQREQATLQVLTQEVIKTSEIEGERLSLDATRNFDQALSAERLFGWHAALARGVLRRLEGGGRSTGFALSEK